MTTKSARVTVNGVALYYEDARVMQSQSCWPSLYLAVPGAFNE
jgi:hypothetical protein